MREVIKADAKTQQGLKRTGRTSFDKSILIFLNLNRNMPRFSHYFDFHAPNTV